LSLDKPFEAGIKMVAGGEYSGPVNVGQDLPDVAPQSRRLL
jgi:hypothetical protein